MITFKSAPAVDADFVLNEGEIVGLVWETAPGMCQCELSIQSNPYPRPSLCGRGEGQTGAIQDAIRNAERDITSLQRSINLLKETK